MRTPPIIVMGVQGSGKSTIGTLLAERLGARFVDGDNLHPAENKAVMAAGHALQDEHRLPWLHAVGERLAEDPESGIVIACSALKRGYRELLRGHAPALFTVDVEGPIELVAARIKGRAHEFMPPGLLQSQYDTLEVRDDDERGVTVDLVDPPNEIVDRIIAALAADTEGRDHVADHSR